MPMCSIPAPGFKLTSGKKNPPKTKDGYWVQLRSGWVDELGPWPAVGPRWIHEDSPHDVIAVKKA